MGKGLLFILAGVILASGYLMLDVRMAGQESDEEQISYEETVLAREIAQSAFDQGVSNIQRDFDWRQTKVNQKYQGGHYDLTATGAGTGEVNLVVEGRYGKARVQMSTKLVRKLDDFLDALDFDVDDVVDPKAEDKIIITGNDTPPPSAGGGITKIGTGSGPNATAFKAIVKTVRDKVADKFPATRVYGAGGTGDFQWGEFDIDLDKLYDEAIYFKTPDEIYTEKKYEDITFTGVGAHVFRTSKLDLKGVTFSTAGVPAVVRISADEVKFDATTKGYGVLYVNAKKVEFKDGFLWEGLVLLDLEDGVKAEVKMDKAQVFGSMVIRRGEEAFTPEVDNDDKGLPGGHFDVDVFAPYKGKGMSKIYHQHQYDDKFDVTFVDLFSPTGCKTNGGLCWNDLVKDMGYTNLRVDFFNNTWSSGNYTIETSTGGSYTGNPKDDFDKVLDVSKITKFRVTFDDLINLWATSPGQVQSDQVNRNNAFTVRLYDGTKLVYELSVYEHDNRCNYCTDTEKRGGVTAEEGGTKDDDKKKKKDPIKFEIKGENAGIFYSTKTLVKLAPLLETVAEKIQPVIENYRVRSTDLKGNFSSE